MYFNTFLRWKSAILLSFFLFSHLNQATNQLCSSCELSKLSIWSHEKFQDHISYLVFVHLIYFNLKQIQDNLHRKSFDSAFVLERLLLKIIFFHTISLFWSGSFQNFENFPCFFFHTLISLFIVVEIFVIFLIFERFFLSFFDICWIFCWFFFIYFFIFSYFLELTTFFSFFQFFSFFPHVLWRKMPWIRILEQSLFSTSTRNSQRLETQTKQKYRNEIDESIDYTNYQLVFADWIME